MSLVIQAPEMSNSSCLMMAEISGLNWAVLKARLLQACSLLSGEPLFVSEPSTYNIAGKIHRAQVYDGIDGTLVADFDPSLSRQPHRSLVDSVGNVWTINRSTSGRKAALVDQPMFLFGTDDYMEAPDHDDLDFGAGQDFTVVVCVSATDIMGSPTGILSARGRRSPDRRGWATRGQVAATTKAMTSDGATSVVDWLLANALILSRTSPLSSLQCEKQPLASLLTSLASLPASPWGLTIGSCERNAVSGR